ncbi:hypothetical protein KHA80_13075 [Anaerobacillus sp. HL2]|nr:hypothetical protein KHA80_13075 [Anaerobacillus sp. HL2]
MTVINDAIERVSAERSVCSVQAKTVWSTHPNLRIHLRITSCRIRVRDVDMAREVMKMTKDNILAQASRRRLHKLTKTTISNFNY